MCWAGDNAVAEAVQVAAASGMRALSVDYHMPPEFPFPAAIDDTITVYRETLQSYAPAAVAIGGTSTGGGLSLAAVHRMCKWTYLCLVPSMQARPGQT